MVYDLKFVCIFVFFGVLLKILVVFVESRVIGFLLVKKMFKDVGIVDFRNLLTDDYYFGTLLD